MIKISPLTGLNNVFPHVYIHFTQPPENSEDIFNQYLTQLLHSTTTKSHLPPIKRGQHHVFSAEHTTRDILSLMAKVQGLNIPSELLFVVLVMVS